MANPEFRLGLFARTFLLLALLMLASLAAWLHVFWTLEQEPRTIQVADQITQTVQLVRVALENAQPHSQSQVFDALARTTGIQWRAADPLDQLTPLPQDPFWSTVANLVYNRLGQTVELAQTSAHPNTIWVQLKSTISTPWIGLNIRPIGLITGPEWVSWIAAAALLSLTGAAVAVGYMNRPLARLAHAAQALSRGQNPEPLPESGAQEIRDLNSSFNKMVEQLHQAQADRNLMLAGISHDLRTPLARMRLEVEMSLMTDAQQRAIDEDLSQIDRTLAQLMDYARPVNAPPSQAINLHDLAAQVIATANEHGVYGCHVDLSCRARWRTVCRIDPLDFERCLSNLLQNARRYSSKNGELSINVVLLARGERIYVDVRDRGPGIDPKNAADMLKPFFRGESARTGGAGSGLGLAIVERLIAPVGGRLRLLPRDGGGLIARMDLPRARGSRHTRTVNGRSVQ
jgi:two-component system, OmpR family, osmolarity sensor histidine kinase EnvZ